VELDKLGVIVEDRLPDPALARYGQLTHELFSMLAFAADRSGLVATSGRSQFLTSASSRTAVRPGRQRQAS
jgi:hypothetical protein